MSDQRIELVTFAFINGRNFKNIKMNKAIILALIGAVAYARISLPASAHGYNRNAVAPRCGCQGPQLPQPPCQQQPQPQPQHEPQPAAPCARLPETPNVAAPDATQLLPAAPQLAPGEA